METCTGPAAVIACTEHHNVDHHHVDDNNHLGKFILRMVTTPIRSEGLLSQTFKTPSGDNTVDPQKVGGSAGLWGRLSQSLFSLYNAERPYSPNCGV